MKEFTQKKTDEEVHDQEYQDTGTEYDKRYKLHHEMLYARNRISTPVIACINTYQ